MLKILDEKVLKTDTEIRALYKDCKYVYIIDRYDKAVDEEDYLYCINTSDDSYKEPIHERDRLEDEGKICVFRGSYNNGGAVGDSTNLKENHFWSDRDLNRINNKKSDVKYGIVVFCIRFFIEIRAKLIFDWTGGHWFDKSA